MAEAYSLDTRPVAQLPETDRATFLGRVYTHLAAAIVLFVAFEFVLFQAGIAERVHDFVTAGGTRWLMFMGLFMVGSWLGQAAASDLRNTSKQYAGLFGMSAVYSLIFTVPLYRVFEVENNSGTVWSAAFVTALGFAGLTAVAWFTKSDLSFLRPVMMFGGVIALIAIVGSIVFKIQLGAWFSIAMIGLMGVSILYQTQSIVRRYPADAYVGAAVQLFSSVMMMFWYVLRLFMSRD